MLLTLSDNDFFFSFLILLFLGSIIIVFPFCVSSRLLYARSRRMKMTQIIKLSQKSWLRICATAGDNCTLWEKYEKEKKLLAPICGFKVLDRIYIAVMQLQGQSSDQRVKKIHSPLIYLYALMACEITHVLNKCPAIR